LSVFEAALRRLQLEIGTDRDDRSRVAHLRENLVKISQLWLKIWILYYEDSKKIDDKLETQRVLSMICISYYQLIFSRSREPEHTDILSEQRTLQIFESTDRGKLIYAAYEQYIAIMIK
jgi:hypothetical protein